MRVFACFEEKQGQNTLFNRERPSTKVCTCRTLANECQCNTRSIIYIDHHEGTAQKQAVQDHDVITVPSKSTL